MHAGICERQLSWLPASGRRHPSSAYRRVCPHQDISRCRLAGSPLRETTRPLLRRTGLRRRCPNTISCESCTPRRSCSGARSATTWRNCKLRSATRRAGWWWEITSRGSPVGMARTCFRRMVKTPRRGRKLRSRLGTTKAWITTSAGLDSLCEWHSSPSSCGRALHLSASQFRQTESSLSQTICQLGMSARSLRRTFCAPRRRGLVSWFHQRWRRPAFFLHNSPHCQSWCARWLLGHGRTMLQSDRATALSKSTASPCPH
mmetsp:Transcript_107305/g.186353  ORF Transcript_107305/g.186353 Transcript_107305/m.186353 type:complete len:260 (+) Transcript_107305:61-840(+)